MSDPTNPPAWACKHCGQLNSAWSNECGRCENPKVRPTHEEFRVRLQAQLESSLETTERIVGPNYKLTLVARYIKDDGKDADIVMTSDDFGKAIETINKMKGRSE